MSKNFEKLHKYDSKNEIQNRKPEPISPRSIIFEIISSNMRQNKRCYRRPEEICRTHIDTHESGRQTDGIDVGDIWIHIRFYYSISYLSPSTSPAPRRRIIEEFEFCSSYSRMSFAVFSSQSPFLTFG